MDRALTCVIIDDEPLAQHALRQSLERLPSVRLLAAFANALEASAGLSALNPDLIFLDIHLPEVS